MGTSPNGDPSKGELVLGDSHPHLLWGHPKWGPPAHSPSGTPLATSPMGTCPKMDLSNRILSKGIQIHLSCGDISKLGPPAPSPGGTFGHLSKNGGPYSMGPVLGGGLSTSHMGMCPNGDLNALLPQGHLQVGMSFHLSKGRPLATSPKQGPPLQGDFFQDGDFCPPSHLMSPNGRHPLFPSPKWISQARTLFCPSGLSQGDISKWGSSLSPRGTCVHLSKEILSIWRTLSKGDIFKWQDPFSLSKRRTFQGGTPL